MDEIERAHEVNCLMCAVRALTSGPVKVWVPQADETGAEVTGVILRIGKMPDKFPRAGEVTYWDLWQGGRERIRVFGRGMVLEYEMVSSEATVGDTVTVRFEGMKDTNDRKRKYRDYSVSVRRGH